MYQTDPNNLIIIPNNSYFDILPSNGFIERNFRPHFSSYSFYYYLKFYFFISIIFLKIMLGTQLLAQLAT